MLNLEPGVCFGLDALAWQQLAVCHPGELINSIQYSDTLQMLIRNPLTSDLSDLELRFDSHECQLGGAKVYLLLLIFRFNDSDEHTFVQPILPSDPNGQGLIQALVGVTTLRIIVADGPRRMTVLHLPASVLQTPHGMGMCNKFLSSDKLGVQQEVEVCSAWLADQSPAVIYRRMLSGGIPSPPAPAALN